MIGAHPADKQVCMGERRTVRFAKAMSSRRHFMARRVSVWCVVVLLLGATSALSTTIAPLSFEQIVARAETIFLGEVVSRRSDWEAGPAGKSIITTVTFKVHRVLKGPPAVERQLTFLGGTIGTLEMSVAGVPQFRVGDRDVLFVTADTHAVSPIAGFSQGRFRLVGDGDVSRAEMRTHDGRPLPRAAATSRPFTVIDRSARSTTYPEFEALVLQTLAAGTR